MKHQKGEKPKLHKIARLFSEIEEVFNSLSQETQHEIYEVHNENYTIQHCIRWGTQASTEIVDITKLDKQ